MILDVTTTLLIYFVTLLLSDLKHESQYILYYANGCGNAGALNALDLCACFSPAVKHPRTDQAPLFSLSSPSRRLSFSAVIGCLLSIRPSSLHAHSQSAVHLGLTDIRHWLACDVNADARL